MEYKELSKLYHMDPSSSRDAANKQEAEKRLAADSTFKIGYKAAEGELFIAVPRELSMLNEKVLRTERLVSSRIKAMPSIASNSLLRGLVLDEIVSSNMIEGVRSTRRQIKDVLNAMDSQNSVRRRFKELATLYMAIIDETALLPTSPEDVRAIYDKIMDGELHKKDLPDGSLFRAHGVDVVSNTRIIHSGLSPEDKITKAVGAMLNVASRDDMPAMYGAVASHYLFEYAHPFYDGNGRTGRYLLALYLSLPLSMATSLSLSRTIADNKSKYYKAFETAQDPLNHGELTHFVLQMLEFINLAQDQLLKRLDISEELFSNINGAMSDVVEGYDLKDQEKNVIYMLMQYEVFGLLGDAPLPEIARHLSVGDQMARRYLSTLAKHDIVKKVRGRDPVTFALTDSFKNRLGIAVQEEALRN